ncbi:hypothetical protein DAPPUDRAFT_254478 [Daphnia pulex]|uniref:C1q domain-containing protein n=1 Tax=Daphnia pulex TaxID=6669 RepID=E9H760_DAPPU|nr:hypothetical protein DAPPUDRAFT_254478 [Daphnia pulex]|eukprot:EFX72320.1 hypothetical protein DAPPUDRAFT_254478 [Daphnia pulex]
MLGTTDDDDIRSPWFPLLKRRPPVDLRQCMCFGGGWARAITEPAPLIYTTGWPQQHEARIDPPVTFESAPSSIGRIPKSFEDLGKIGQRKSGLFKVIGKQSTTSSAYWNPNTVIPFKFMRLNVGNAMRLSGIFVAPKSGKYFFSFLGISEGHKESRVELQVKTEIADWSKVGDA